LNLVSPTNQITLTKPLINSETFSVLATSSLGCTATATVSVNVSNSPIISTQPQATSICAGKNVSFSVAVSGFDLRYQWKINGANIDTIINPSAATSTLNLVNVNASNAGNYSVVITSSCGLSVTSSGALLTVNALPLVSINSLPSNGLICFPGGIPVSLTASNAISFLWSPATGLSSTNASTVSANPSNTQTYSVVGTDINGCSSIATTTISVLPKPTVTASNTSSPICSGGNSQLNATPINTTVPNYTFSNNTTTYTEINGGIVLGTIANDEEVFNNNLIGAFGTVKDIGFPLNFSFYYNNTYFDKFAVATNGYIVLGNDSFSIASTALNALSTSTTLGFANLIAPFHSNLNGQAGSELSYLTTGTIGNRILTEQWKNYTSTSSFNSIHNFQVKLYENGGRIDFVYGNNVIAVYAGAVYGKVGFRGINNSFTNTRTTASDWHNTTPGINTSTCKIDYFTPPASGTTFVFTPTVVSTYLWSQTTYISGSESIPNPIAT
jgi:hypothetical protein